MMKILIMMALIILVSCNSGSDSTKKKNVEVSLGALSSNDFDGGLELKIVNKVTGEIIKQLITSSTYKITLANGTWDFFLVGKDTTNFFCGSELGLVLTGDDTSVDITAAQVNCTDSVYSDLLPTNLSQWDAGTFDNSLTTWGS